MTKTVEHHAAVLTAQVSPADVDAGASLSFKVHVACPHGCNLGGTAIAVRDEDGRDHATGHLASGDTQGGFDTEIAVKAPPVAGARVFTVVLAAEEGGITHEASAETTFAVIAHAAYIHIWDVPSAIAAGERFAAKLGIKCSCGCNLGGRGFRVRDHDGTEVTSGALRNEVWHGTAALYFASVEATAPIITGDYTWTVELPGWTSELPHQAAEVTFGIKIVPAPDHEVRVEVLDRASQAPVKGIPVLLHPYSALTDEAGVARIKVARGTYRLHISGRKYVPCREVIDADSNVVVKVRLAAEVPHSPFFPTPIKQEPSVAEVVR